MIIKVFKWSEPGHNLKVVTTDKKEDKTNEPARQTSSDETEWTANAPEDIDIEKGDTEYEIQWGDTLWAIAIKADTTVEHLVELNNIESPDLIYAGDTIQLI